MSESDKATQKLAQKLLEELREDSSLSSDTDFSLTELALKDIENASDNNPQVLFDLSTLAASSGHWNIAFSSITKLLTLKSGNWHHRLWELRCLHELGRYSEVTAIGSNFNVPKKFLNDFNYLMGLSFQALKMYDQARTRLSAVYKVNPKYRDIAERVLNLGGSNRIH